MYFRSHCVNKTIEKERVRSDGKQAEGLNKNGPVGMERRRTDSRKGTSLRKGSSVEVWRLRTGVWGPFSSRLWNLRRAFPKLHDRPPAEPQVCLLTAVFDRRASHSPVYLLGFHA